MSEAPLPERPPLVQNIFDFLDVLKGVDPQRYGAIRDMDEVLYPRRYGAEEQYPSTHDDIQNMLIALANYRDPVGTTDHDVARREFDSARLQVVRTTFVAAVRGARISTVHYSALTDNTLQTLASIHGRRWVPQTEITNLEAMLRLELNNSQDQTLRWRLGAALNKLAAQPNRFQRVAEGIVTALRHLSPFPER